LQIKLSKKLGQSNHVSGYLLIPVNTYRILLHTKPPCWVEGVCHILIMGYMYVLMVSKDILGNNVQWMQNKPA